MFLVVFMGSFKAREVKSNVKDRVWGAKNKVKLQYFMFQWSLFKILVAW